MIKILKKNKAVLKFLGLFGGSYLVLSYCYNQYLNLDFSEKYYPDWVTHWVTKQSLRLTQFLGYDAHAVPHPYEASMKYFVEGEYLARIVEGCNAVAVIILFIAFVIAFHAQWLKTIAFILFGLVFIYLLNVLRISLLCIGMYEYPDYQRVLHDIVFPGFIYGVVFALWLLWMRIGVEKKK